MPCDWRPNQVRNPSAGESFEFFTEEGAWQFVADLLESEQEIEVITLEKPPGAAAFVMKVTLLPNLPRLYIKVQPGCGKIIGRSFHDEYA